MKIMKKRVGKDIVGATEGATEVLLYFFVSLESTWILGLDFQLFFYMYRKSLVLKSSPPSAESFGFLIIKNYAYAVLHSLASTNEPNLF